MEQLPAAEAPPAGRASRMELKEESRTRALVQSRGGGLQPKMQDLLSGSGARWPLPCNEEGGTVWQVFAQNVSCFMNKLRVINSYMCRRRWGVIANTKGCSPSGWPGSPRRWAAPRHTGACRPCRCKNQAQTPSAGELIAVLIHCTGQTVPGVENCERTGRLVATRLLNQAV